MLINKNLNNSISDDCEFELFMGNHLIERTKTYRYLGILLDEKFSWTAHINEICIKLSQVAGILYEIRTLLSKEAIMLLYHGLAGSKLRYGLICWATAQKSLLNKIEVAQNKIITHMTFSKRCSRMWPLYCQIKVLPLKILIQIEYGKTMYKFLHNLLPAAFNGYFNKPCHQHNTRFSSTNFEISRMSTAIDSALLKNIGPRFWAEIPLVIKDSPSLKVFIKSLRIHLIGNFSEAQ